MLAMIDLYLLLSTHPSIHVYIIYLSIIHPFIHTHIYPSIHLYLSMHLSFIYIMYALSMYLSSSHPSVHVSIIYQLSLNSFIYLSKLSIYPSIYLSIYLSIYQTSLVAEMVKCLPIMQETLVQSLGWEDLLEEEMATHSSILAWKIPWMEESGRLQYMGLQRVGHD